MGFHYQVTEIGLRVNDHGGYHANVRAFALPQCTVLITLTFMQYSPSYGSKPLFSEKYL